MTMRGSRSGLPEWPMRHVDVLGGGYKWHYSDKQYRSLMMSNTRNHYIHVTCKGCKKWWVRVSAPHPEGGNTDDSTTVEADRPRMLQ